MNAIQEIATPIPMPDLISGAGEDPSRGACIMQAAAWLGSDGAWCDMPPCVSPVLRRVAINVNDYVGHAERQELWGLLPWLVGTGPTGDRAADNRVNVALAVWSAERVIPLIRDNARNKLARERVAHARTWLDDGQRPAADAYAAYAASVAAAYAAASAAAAYAAASAASVAAAYAAASAAAAYAAASAASVAYAYAAASAAVKAARSAARIGFLRDLIGEYNRITGRTEPADIPIERWQEFRELLPAKTPFASPAKATT